MAKCGKGCMPECQYFNTSGCISPFNCQYKVEGTYSNSTTSDTAYHAGASYTEAQPDKSEAGIRKWYREQVGHEPANYDAAALKAYIAHLEAENAELQYKDMNCVNSVDEMIAMCDKCGLFDCCGCEHSYVAVQGVKELKIERKSYEVAANQYRIWFEEQKHCAEVAEKVADKALLMVSDVVFTANAIDCSFCPVKDNCYAKCTNDCVNSWKTFLKEQAEKELAEEGKDE